MLDKRDYPSKSTTERVRDRNAHIWLARFPQDFSTASSSHLDKEHIRWHSLLYIHIVQAFIICVNILKTQAWIEIISRLKLKMWLKRNIALEFIAVSLSLWIVILTIEFLSYDRECIPYAFKTWCKRYQMKWRIIE